MIGLHRINARKQLFRQLQQFFEQHLTGLWTISDVAFEPPELLPKERGRRQLHREIVTGYFGAYTICLSSPEEKPPLGEISCTSFHGLSVRGPLDARIWELIAAEIKLDPGGHFDVDRGRSRRRAVS